MNYETSISGTLNTGQNFVNGSLKSFENPCAAAYLFGFNGQEADDEITGSRSHYTAMFWEYDSRIGRRWNLDPKPDPSLSYYACFANNPIWFADPLGDTIKLEGSKRDMRKFTRQLGRTTGNKYGFDENGILYNKGNSSNIATDSKKSGELSGIVGSAMADEETFTLSLVRNDSKTLGDSYDRGTVDVGDFSKMDRIMKAGQFTHFLTERMENPGDYSLANRTNANFAIAHDKALEAESRVVNAMLGQPYVKVIQADKLMPIHDESGNVTGYYFRATSTYGSTVYGFSYGANIVPVGGGRSRVDPTGTMLTRYKKIK